MSRLLSWIVPALLLAGGWFAWTQGKPMFEHWKLKRVAEEVCKDTAVRVTRGLGYGNATDEVRQELVSRVHQRAGLTLTEYMYEVTIWSGKCSVTIKLENGNRIRAQTDFPRESDI